MLERLPQQTPVAVSLGDCGPAGDAPERTLNATKSRVDGVASRAWQSVPWAVVAHLPWLRNASYGFRTLWTAGERQEVARYEGRAIELEG